MGENNFKKRLRNEFNEFIALEGGDVPKGVSESILGHVRTSLNPSSSSVFLKLTLIHFIVGVATLALCPQFGVSLTSSMGLMHYLMQFGESVCMMGCGAVFVGSSLLVASLVLRPEEVKVLRKNRVLQILSLSTLSLALLIGVGGEVVLSFGLAWVLGAILGGTGLLQIGWTIRRAAVQGVL